MHLRDILSIAYDIEQFPTAGGDKEAWIDHIVSPETLNRLVEDTKTDRDRHQRLLWSRSSNGDIVVIRPDTTEMVRQRRASEAARARLLATLNAYPAPFAIYDSSQNLVI